jgi:hypothetical protein
MAAPESPPPPPWVKGKGEDYAAFVIEVHICETYPRQPVRMVYSHHDFQSDLDQETARGLISAGEEQIAYALLLNAVRREGFIEALIQFQQDNECIDRYAAADADERRDLEMELAAKMVTMLSRSIRKMAPEVARETLVMMSEK